jgi:hypothetical protein
MQPHGGAAVTYAQLARSETLNLTDHPNAQHRGLRAGEPTTRHIPVILLTAARTGSAWLA